VKEVWLIRRNTGFPEGPDDGVIIWSTTDITVGETIEVIDHGAPKTHLYYTVYASDGENILSWNREGLNAVKVMGEGEARSEATGLAAACGCSTDPSPATALALLGLLGVVRRRRE
jgi:MYXO-CTERM domain-containing protein